MPRLTARNRATLKRHREALGWSCQQLADKAGVHRVTVAHVESGAKVPSAELLSTIADALGLDVSVTTTVRIRPRKDRVE